MNGKDLAKYEDSWNAMISVLSEYDDSSQDPVLHEASLVFHYYSELESGGHEALMNRQEVYIEEIGIEVYANKLVAILEKIGAPDYATIENGSIREMWRLYVALGNDEMEEEAFYRLIEKADADYHKLNGELEKLLETYFMDVYADLHIS